MRGIVLACIIVFYASVGNAAVHILTWTRDLPLDAPSAAQVMMVTCDDPNVSRTFYWIAMQNGVQVAHAMYAFYFELNECRRRSVAIQYETYLFCKHHRSDFCGEILVTFEDGTKEFGVLVP